MEPNLFLRKRKIKSLFILRFFFKHYLFISFCGVAFFLSGSLLINQKYPSFTESSLVFWATLLVYQINTNVDFNSLNFKAYRSIKFPLKKRLGVWVLLFIIITVHIPFIKLAASLFLLHLAILSTLYNVPKESKGFIRLPLRTIPFLKIFLIAYVWASISSFLPAILFDMSVLSKQSFLIFFSHFLFIVAITLPFDIRDFNRDHMSSLLTIPHLVGIKATKILAISCLIGFALIIVEFIFDGYLIVFCLLTAILILYSSPPKKNYYYLLFIDGTIILYFFMIVLSLK